MTSRTVICAYRCFVRQNGRIMPQISDSMNLRIHCCRMVVTWREAHIVRAAAELNQQVPVRLLTPAKVSGSDQATGISNTTPAPSSAIAAWFYRFLL